MNNLSQKNIIFRIYLYFTFTISFLPIIAPILLKTGLEIPAKVIYFVYSFFCHQFSSRSIHIFDFQYAWCARDTGIWIGIFIGSFLTKLRFLKGVRWYMLILFILPIGLDGGIQTIATFLGLLNSGLSNSPAYLSNNFLRFLTGFVFGIGMGSWISKVLLEQTQIVKNEINNSDIVSVSPIINENNPSKKHSLIIIKNFKLPINTLKFLITFTFGFVIYFFMIQIWHLTSLKYLPTNFLDSIPKQSSQFFLRRENGVCPTDAIQDVLNLKCFFGG